MDRSLWNPNPAASRSLPPAPPATSAPVRPGPGDARRGSRLGLGNWLEGIDLLRGSAFAIIIISISTVQTYLGPLNSLRPALLATGLAMAAVFFMPQQAAWKNFQEGWPVKAIFVMFVIACFSVPFGISLGGSVRFMLDLYLRALVPFFLMVLAIRNVKDLALLAWAFLLSIGILVVLSMTILELRPVYGGMVRMQGITTYDTNDLGMLYLCGLPLALLMLFNARTLGRLLSLGVLIGIPVSLAYTGSRGAMVGLVVVGPILFLALSRINIVKRLVGAGIVVGGLIVGAPEGYWEQMRTILDPSEDYNVTSELGRAAIAKRGVGYMLRYPFFGVGLGNFNRAEGTLSPLTTRYLSSGTSAWIAPHNTYIQVGVELGVFALGIWLALLWAGSVGLWRLRRRIPPAWETQSAERRFLREMCLFLPVSFVAFAVTTFFLSHAYTAPIYVLVTLLTGTLVLVNRELRKDGLVQPQPKALR